MKVKKCCEDSEYLELGVDNDGFYQSINGGEYFTCGINYCAYCGKKLEVERV